MMKKISLLLFLLVVNSSLMMATTYFVAPNGSDASPGTINNPFGTIQFAVNKAAPGDIIYLREGEYKISTQITIAPANSGNSSAMIKLWAYLGEKPYLNFFSQPIVKQADESFLRGFLITGDYWHLKGFEIYGTADNGIKLEGNYNIIEQLTIHHCGDSGIQLGFGHDTNKGNPGNLCAYNKIINCDSYRNYDFDNNGADADGFACKMHNGKGNVFYGCRAWENADDAWDLFETDWPVELHYCWAWRSGDRTFFIPWHQERTGRATTSFQGNGNGIKLGGNGAGGNSMGVHIVTRSIAFNNSKTTSVKGFDQNNHQGGMILSHCLAWNNGYNYMFETSASGGAKNIFVNNVSIKGARNDYEIETNTSQEINNSWNLRPGVNAAADDYHSLTEEDAKAPRQANGSLPNNKFARLVAGSDLIDKGFKIDSVKYAGAAPDLGPYEYSIVTGIDEDILAQVAVVDLFPNPYTSSFTVKTFGNFTYSLYNVQGLLLEEGEGNSAVQLGENLEPGFYVIRVKNSNRTETIKVNKNR